MRVYFARYLYHGEPRQDLAPEYFDVYLPHDEAGPRLRELPAGQLVHNRDLYTEKELRTSPAYAEGWRRCRGQNGLSARLDRQHGLRIAWGISDPDLNRRLAVRRAPARRAPAAGCPPLRPRPTDGGRG